MGVSVRIVLLLLGVLSAEATLQIATALVPPVQERLSGLKPRYVADPILYVRGDSSLPEYDELGFRNDHRPAEATIVAIGDSQTEGSGVSRANAWPQQLAAHLGTSVYQLAFGSYGPGHYLALLDHALALRPKVIILGLYTGNDLAGAYEWVYGKGRNSELKTDSPEILAELERAERERGAIDHAWRTARDAEKGLHGQPVLGWIRENIEGRSKIVALYEQLQWRIGGRGDDLDADEGPGDWDESLAITEGVPRHILFPFDDGTVRTVFTPQARLAAQDLDDARIAEGLRVTQSVIERIAERCRGRARLLVLLIPTKELVFAPRVLSATQPAPETYTRLVESELDVRARLFAALGERSIETIDPLAEMRWLLATDDPEPTVTNPYPETWDGHPAAIGYTAVSRAVAAAINRPPA
jgi:lysophospholipase L1-like esterase